MAVARHGTPLPAVEIGIPSSNWTPVTVPNGSSDTATFSISTIVGVSISQNVDLADAVFSAGASAFTITASPNIFLQIEGTGISNSSANTQNFVTAVNGMGESGSITLRNSATAGSAAQFTNKGSMVFNVAGGTLQFLTVRTRGRRPSLTMAVRSMALTAARLSSLIRRTPAPAVLPAMAAR